MNNGKDQQLLFVGGPNPQAGVKQIKMVDGRHLELKNGRISAIVWPIGT